MKKIEIYDPAMCCPTGVCGPSVDPELLRMSAVVQNLKKRNYPLERFGLANEPNKFVENQKVNAILNEKGPEALPLIFVDGELVISKRYPTNEELCQWTGLDGDDLCKKPVLRMSLSVKKEGK